MPKRKVRTTPIKTFFSKLAEWKRAFDSTPFQQKFHQSRWRYLWYFFVYLLALYALYFIFLFREGTYNVTDYYSGFRSASAYIAYCCLLVLLFLGEVAYGILLGVRHRLTGKKIAFLLVVLSSAILFLFSGCRYMDTDYFKHDYGVGYSGGHWEIIYLIYTTGKIPDPNLYNQFYQPKLWHFLMAMGMHLNSILIPVPADNPVLFSNFPAWDLRTYEIFESTRIFIDFYGTLTLYFFYKILCKLHLKGAKLVIATLLCTFTPMIWYVPFFGNNDSLALFFGLVAIFFSLSYLERPSFVDAILCALFLGAGMSAKLSTAMAAFPIAFVFLYQLYREYRKGNSFGKKDRLLFWLQMAVFALVVFPTGLGLAIYDKVKFGEPIGYVLNLENEHYWSNQHIDTDAYGFFNRFLFFPTGDFSFSIFPYINDAAIARNGYYDSAADCYRYSFAYGTLDYNVWTAWLKSALWNESVFNTPGPILFFSYLLVITYIILGLFFVMAEALYTLLLLFRKEKNAFLYLFVATTFLTSAFSYCYFAYKYPVWCSMNSRYSLYLFLPFSIGIASFIGDGAHFLASRFAHHKVSEPI
jgi:hypothetical protein